MLRKLTKKLQPHIIDFDANPIDAYLFLFSLPIAFLGWIFIIGMGARFTDEFVNSLPYFFKVLPLFYVFPYFIWAINRPKLYEMIRLKGYTWLLINLAKIIFVMFSVFILVKLLLQY